MTNWLIGLSEVDKTDDELLIEAVTQLPANQLSKLAFDLDPLSMPTAMDTMAAKIDHAINQGRELAQQLPQLEKIAFLPALAAGAARLLPTAGKAIGEGGLKSLAGGVAKDMAISAAGNKVMGALKPAAPAASAAGEIAGGFKYAGISNLMNKGFVQRAAGYVAKNPGTALTAAGAVGGALMAPRDQQTGQKQYLKGALVGGGLAAGANAVSNGAIANKMRSSVMNRESPLLGQGARQYMMNAAASTKGKIPGEGGRYTRLAPATAPMQAPQAAPVVSSAPYMGGPVMRGLPAEHSGGPMMGAVKVAFLKRANRQMLTYDPATRTFTRQHLDASPGSESLTAMGAPPIPAGHREMVRNSETGMHHFGTPEYVNARIDKIEKANPSWEKTTIPPKAAPVSRAVPPPIPAAALRKAPGGIAGMAGAAAKPSTMPNRLVGALSKLAEHNKIRHR